MCQLCERKIAAVKKEMPKARAGVAKLWKFGWDNKNKKLLISDINSKIKNYGGYLQKGLGGVF